MQTAKQGIKSQKQKAGDLNADDYDGGRDGNGG